MADGDERYRLNREELRLLMRRHGLTNQDVADLCAVSIYAARSWTRTPHQKTSEASSYRSIPEGHLRLVRLLAPAWKEGASDALVDAALTRCVG